MAINITTRLSKGNPLTAAEMDGNLIGLKTGVESVETSLNSLTGSTTSDSASFSARLDSIEGLSTSSLSGSLSDRVSTLETFETTITPQVDGLLEYSASNKELIDDLLAWTASNGTTGLADVQTSVAYLNLATSSLSSSISSFAKEYTDEQITLETTNIGNDINDINTLISELQAFTSSLNNVSSSFGSDNTALNDFTQSVLYHTQSVNTFTSSISSSVGDTIASVATLTSAANIQFNSLFASSSEITSSLAAIKFSVDSINSKTGSFSTGGGGGSSIFTTGSQDSVSYDYWSTENNLQVSGTLSIRDGLYIDQNLVLEFDSIGTSSLSSDIIPDTNSVRSLGTESSRFKTIFVDNLYAGNNIISASSQLNGETLSNITLQTATATGSFTGSFSGSFNGSFTGDASGLINFPPGIFILPQGLISGSEQITTFGFVSGSYATTGSNTFEGKQTVNDDIEATGAITASAFKVTGQNSIGVVFSETELILSASRVAVSGSFKLNPTTTAVVGSTPADGDLYFDSGSQTIYFGKNSSWVAIHSGSTAGVGTYSQILDLFVSQNPLWDSSYQIVSESAQIAGMLNGEELLDYTSLDLNAGILNSQLAEATIHINNTSVGLGNTASVDLILGGTDVLSGSVAYNSLNSSFHSYTASINAYTESINQFTSSFASGFATLLSNEFIGNQEVTGSIFASGSFTIDLASGSAGLTDPNYFTIIKSQTVNNGNIRIGHGPGYNDTASFQISTNLYYNTVGALTKDDNTINGWAVQFLNTGDGNKSFSINHSPEDSSDVTKIFELRDNGAPNSIQTFINSELTVNGDLNLVNNTISANVVSANVVSASGGGFFDTGLTIDGPVVLSGSIGIVPTFATSSMVVTTQGYVTLPHVLMSLDFQSSEDAINAGVPVGGIYRCGELLMIVTGSI